MGGLYLNLKVDIKAFAVMLTTSDCHLKKKKGKGGKNLRKVRMTLRA